MREFTCEDARAVHEELRSCSSEKGDQISSLSHMVNGMHGDLMRIEGDMKVLTSNVIEISAALKTIAENTTQFMEVAKIYRDIKGFGFVVKNIGAILIGTAAVITSIVLISGVRLTVGA